MLKAILFAVMALISIFVGYLFYPGSFLIYMLFSLFFCGFVLFSIQIKNTFFVFTSSLLWLGFWVKLNGSFIFNDGKFFEPVGYFDYTVVNYDGSLLIAILGCSGFFIASVVSTFSNKATNFLSAVYLSERRYFIVWVLMALMLGLVCYLNLKYSIYQKATREQYFLPTPLIWLVKWTLFIGFEISFLSMLNIGVLSKSRSLHLYLIATLFFSCVINIATLSRAFPLVGLVILFLIKNFLHSYKVKWKISRWFFVVIIYILLSISSIFLVSAYRSNFIEKNQTILHQQAEVDLGVKPSNGWSALFLGRWIGFEGVASTVSYPTPGIPLLFESLKEVRGYSAPSFYDRVIVANDSSYSNIAQKSYYAITLPGILGYLNYSGIPLLVFFGSFLIAIFSFGFLKLIEFYSNNFLVTGFCAYLVAYRWISFGYVPRDTYLFFVAVVIAVYWSIFLKKIIFIKS